MNVTSTVDRDSDTLSALRGTTASTGARRVSTGSDRSDDPSVSGSHATRHHHGGGGKISDAMMEALQSIGIAVPSPAATGTTAAAGSTDTTTTTGTATTTASSTSADAAGSSAPIDLHKDIGDLMHALFQAVKGESTTASMVAAGTSDGAGGRGANSFASGLSSLISQAANGTAPDSLQAAFKTLTTDLQTVQSGSSATTMASSATASATDTTSTSLQAFLSTLQDKLGYGATGTATSNLISSVA